MPADRLCKSTTFPRNRIEDEVWPQPKHATPLFRPNPRRPNSWTRARPPRRPGRHAEMEIILGKEEKRSDSAITSPTARRRSAAVPAAALSYLAALGRAGSQSRRVGISCASTVPGSQRRHADGEASLEECDASCKPPASFGTTSSFTKAPRRPVHPRSTVVIPGGVCSVAVVATSWTWSPIHGPRQHFAMPLLLRVNLVTARFASAITHHSPRLDREQPSSSRGL
ncbi:hypothetical protein FH972_021193 [Carpinus fangiana]|uniref:Uncharacterized protein n=1 Tax=Carpinus fangiana TaxID=176857 RepID=A0A5N6KP70_9ROSI|nr:hypothetical protein FH972_021193 [Carpinus fangiana]